MASPFSISPATPTDIPGIKAIVDLAYSKYIPRMGQPPAPMKANYHHLLQTHDVFVLHATDDTEGNRKILGCVVVRTDDETSSVSVNNLVVDPAMQGKGFGRMLMGVAEDEARRVGGEKGVVTLYTNVKMWENVEMYKKMGFQEVDRRTEDGYERVYFRKEV